MRGQSDNHCYNGVSRQSQGIQSKLLISPGAGGMAKRSSMSYTETGGPQLSKS